MPSRAWASCRSTSQETPVDILATGAQKWLLSPWGSGFFYVRKEILDSSRPRLPGWLAFQGTDDFSKLTDYNPTWHDDSRRFELITLPFQDFAAMNTSLELILDIGVERDRGAPPAGAGSPCSTSQRGGTSPSPHRAARTAAAIVCLKAPGAARLHGVLRQEEVICSLREGSLRFSPHLFNSVDDVAAGCGRNRKPPLRFEPLR